MKLYAHAGWVSLVLAGAVLLVALLNQALTRDGLDTTGAAVITALAALWAAVFVGLVAAAGVLRVAATRRRETTRPPDPGGGQLVLLALLVGLVVALVALQSVAVSYLAGTLTAWGLLLVVVYFVVFWSVALTLVESGLRRGWRAVDWLRRLVEFDR